MARVKLYAGEHYVWGFTKADPDDPDQKTTLTPMLTAGGFELMRPLYGPQGRTATMTAGGDVDDPREHIIIEAK